MNLAELTIRKKTVSLVLTVAVLVGGVLAFLEMPRLEDPAFTIKKALVITEYPGASPAEVADEVTDVIEAAAQELSQLKRVSSQNIRGRSIVTVEIKDEYGSKGLPQIWDELRRKVNDAQAGLPPGAGPSLVVDDFSDVYGILLAVTGQGYSRQDIQDYADYLRKELLLVKSVAKISVWGKQTETVYVEISRARVNQLGLSMDAVYKTLSDRNLAVSAGNVRVGREYVAILPTGSVESVEDLGDLFIKGATGANLTRLRDIAEIHRGYEEPPGQIMRYQGQSSVALGISMVSTGNVVELGRAIDARLQELQSQTPVGVTISKIYFQPQRVEKAVNSFVINLAEAVGIVILVLLFFMGRQSGLLIGFILVLTILGSFILIQIAGVALERVSLGALIIALGMLVDNAIVVVEGILIRYQKGVDRQQGAEAAVRRNVWPLLGATVVAILAFAGIGLSNDAVGEYCNSLFIVLCISLMMSWITAMTVTPLLCTMFLKPKNTDIKDPYAGRLYRMYKAILTLCLKHRYATMLVLTALLAVAVLGFGHVKQSFFPDSSQPRFFIHYWNPQGTDIRATSSDVETLEKELLADKRIKSVATFVGQGAPRFILTYSPEKTNSSYGMLLVEVKDYEELTAIIADYRQYLAREFPHAEPKVKKFRMGPGREAAIEVRFSGPDSTVLRDLSRQARDIMRDSGKAASIRDDWRQPVKVVRPVLSEAQAKLAGITLSSLSSTLDMVFSGATVGVYREGDNLLPIVVRPPEKERAGVEEIDNVQVFSPVAGKMIPMEEVVSGFETEVEPGRLNTRNRMLTITASCEPYAGLASDLLAEIRPLIQGIPLPTGYTLEWGGEYEDSADAEASLAMSLPLPFTLMVLVTILLFNNLRTPFIIWFTVPLAVIGVTLGLLATGEPFGFMALLGFLSLSGMLIKNSVVLLDQINLELRAGKMPYQAVVDASVSRIRPVTMAAATTIMGMIPLVTDAFFSAMAVTIMSGLAFATLLTLIVVPVLYSLFYKVNNNAP